MTTKLEIDPAACDGVGICAVVAGEVITLDEWGFPPDRLDPRPSDGEAGQACRTGVPAPCAQGDPSALTQTLQQPLIMLRARSCTGRDPGPRPDP